jgi:DNA polymerase III subunit alpha
VIGRLTEVLSTHRGTTEVHLQLHNGSKTTVMRLDDRLRVTPSPALMGDLKQLLGPACVGA